MIPEQLDLGRGLYAWLEGKDRDIAIDDQNQRVMIILTQEQFDRLDAFRKEGRDHG